MNIVFTLLLVVVVAAALFFFKYFTKNGTVPLPNAWRAATVWLSAFGTLAAQWVVDLLAWVAGFWDPMQAQFGDLLSNPSSVKALQLLSAFFFVVRMKGQGFPAFKFPSMPGGNDAAKS